MMNNKYINKGLNPDKNQIISKNQNNTIKNFHDVNNNSKPKADKTASNYDNPETHEKNKNFNMNKNLYSNNHNVFQNNYNLHHEKGINVNSNSDSGFNKIEKGGGASGKGNDKNSVSGFSDRSGSIRFRKIINNGNLNASKQSSLSKFDKYSVERLPNLLHRKNNSVSTDANFLLNKNNEINNNSHNNSNFNNNNHSISNKSSSKISSSAASNYNINIARNPNLHSNINNYNNKNNVIPNINENSKFMKVSNERLNNDHLKNKILSEIQRQKIYANTGNNDHYSAYSSRNNTSDLVNSSNKNYTIIPNNRNISSILHPKLQKISRNNSADLLFNNGNNNNLSNIYGNSSYVNNNTHANAAGFNNSHLSEIFKKRDLSGNDILNNKNNFNSNRARKLANINPAKYKVKSENDLNDHYNYNNKFASKSLSPINFDVYPKKASDNDNKNLANNPNNNKNVSSMGSNIYFRYPENRFAFIENKIKENLINNSAADVGGLRPNKASTAVTARNHREKPSKSPDANATVSNNNSNKLLIRDQEKEKEDKLFEFFLQYKNIRKNNRTGNQSEIPNFNNIDNNLNNSRYHQSPVDETYLGKLSSLNNSSLSKNLSNINSGKKNFDASAERANNAKTNLNPTNKIPNDFSRSHTNLNKEKVKENIKNVKFESNTDTNFNKNKNINFNNSHQQMNEKRTYVNKFINNPNENFNNKEHSELPLIDKNYRKIDNNSVLSEFNRSKILNQNLNKISNTHENFYSKNDFNNNNLNPKFKADLKTLKNLLVIFTDKINNLLLNKKFKIFDELITYAYTKEDLMPPGEAQKSRLFQEENLNEKDLQIIENNYEEENQDLIGLRSNHRNKPYNNIPNNNPNENYEDENSNDYDDEPNNYNCKDETKFNSLKINILKLNLFAIMRIFAKYKKMNFYFFLQKLRIFSDNIKIFNTADNFLYYDHRFKLYKLDNAVAYRKLQYAAKLISNRRFRLKHYFKIWQDLVFNFNLNPQNKYNSNKNNKYVFTDYYKLPKSNLNPSNHLSKNKEDDNSNIDYTNQSLQYQPKLSDAIFTSNSQNKLNLHSESQSGFGFADKNRSNTNENSNSNLNHFNSNSNNLHGVDKILNTYTDSNFDRNNKRFTFNAQQRKSAEGKFITDKEIDDQLNNKNQNFNNLNHFNASKISKFTANKVNTMPDLNPESKPALINFKNNKYLEEEHEEDYIPKDRKEISYTNKLTALTKINNNNNLKNLNEDSDDMPMSQSDDEGIQSKLVINNFERVNSDADFSLQEIKFNNNNTSNKAYNSEFDSKNSLRIKIFRNFISTIDRKRMEMLKAQLIKAAFFRVFVLKTFGETPLKEIMDKRVRTLKAYLMRKFESIRILDKIFLRRKREAKNVLMYNLGLAPALGILDSIPLDDSTLNLLNDNNFNFNFPINENESNQIVPADGNSALGSARGKQVKELKELFKIYKIYATNLSRQNLLNLAEYLNKRLPKNAKINFAPEPQDMDFIAELILKNFIDDTKLNLFRGLFSHENAFEFLKIKTLSNLGNKSDQDNKEKRLTEIYVKENEDEDENDKYNEMTRLFLSCDNSEKFKGLLKINILTYKLRSSNKTLLKHFNKWKYINDYLKMQDILSRKGKQTLRLSFINDKVFYTKKNPKTEIKILRKDLNNIRIYALNCILKAVNNILFNNKNLILAKHEFFTKFLLDIKLKNTLKLYGENYKKINSFMGIENYSNRKKNVLLIRGAYKCFFQLQKVFLLCEKYRYGFSRYLNFVNNQVLVSQLSNKNNNNNNNNFNLENKNNSLIASNKNVSNINDNLPVARVNYSNKLYKILNFTSTADANYFNKKKAEAKEACFANLYLNVCFSKWKLLIYRSLNSKIETQKNLILFIKLIENIYVQKLNNEGKYFLISNLHIENDRKEFNKENESSNLIKSSNNNFHQSDKEKQQLQTVKPPRAGSAAGVNSKKLILIEEKIKIYTKYNRFVYLTKLEFFQNFRQKAEMRKLIDNKVAKMHNNILFVTCNLFSYKTSFFKIEFLENFKNFVEFKSKKLQKQEALRSIIELQRLANSRLTGQTKSLADFAKKYYTQVTLRRNTLQKYFSVWKNEVRKFLNKLKVQEKFNYEKYHEELSPGIYENNKLFAEKLEVIKQKKLNSGRFNANKNMGFNFSAVAAEENQSLDNSTNLKKTNQEINEEFGEKVIHFTNNEFQIFFFKILAESKVIPKSKLMFFLRDKVLQLHKKNLNHFFKKFRVKLNMYFTYNKLLAAFYSNQNLLPGGVVKDEAYFLGLGNKKIPSLPEQLGNKIRITAPAKPPKEIESGVKVASLSQKLSVQRVDYLINQNQSKIILDYEQDEMRLDKEINFCKKIISEKSYLKLARIFIANKIKAFLRCFSKWKNAAFYPEKDYYNNILENFENVRSENEILINTLNKAKSDYKKLIQDYKTLKNYFCENCMNGGEEFVLDMKSVKSDTSNNINASDLRADSNYNSENNNILNKRKSVSRNPSSPNVSLNNKISEMEKNIKNLQNEYSNKKTEYETMINNFEEKKKELLDLKMKLLESKRNGNQQ